MVGCVALGKIYFSYKWHKFVGFASILPVAHVQSTSLEFGFVFFASKSSVNGNALFLSYLWMDFAQIWKTIYHTLN